MTERADPHPPAGAAVGYYNNCLTEKGFVFMIVANCLFVIILISNRQ